MPFNAFHLCRPTQYFIYSERIDIGCAFSLSLSCNTGAAAITSGHGSSALRRSGLSGVSSKPFMSELLSNSWSGARPLIHRLDRKGRKTPDVHFTATA